MLRRWRIPLGFNWIGPAAILASVALDRLIDICSIARHHDGVTHGSNAMPRVFAVGCAGLLAMLFIGNGISGARIVAAPLPTFQVDGRSYHNDQWQPRPL